MHQQLLFFIVATIFALMTMMMMTTTSESSFIDAAKPAPPPVPTASSAFPISIRYQYLGNANNNQLINNISNSESMRTQKMLVKEILSTLQLPNTTFFDIRTNQVVENNATKSTHVEEANRATIELIVYFFDAYVYSTILNNTNLLIDDSSSSSSSTTIYFVGNTVVIKTIAAAPTTAPVTPKYPKEGLAIAVLVTVIIVAVFLILFFYGIYKSSKEDFKTSEELANKFSAFASKDPQEPFSPPQQQQQQGQRENASSSAAAATAAPSAQSTSAFHSDNIQDGKEALNMEDHASAL